MPPDETLTQTQQLSPAVGITIGIVYLVILVILIASGWKLFSKAGEPGWAAIIPIYNTIVTLKIAGKPLWWFFLLLIPFVNFVIILLVLISFVERFGKGAGYSCHSSSCQCWLSATRNTSDRRPRDRTWSSSAALIQPISKRITPPPPDRNDPAAAFFCRHLSGIQSRKHAPGEGL
jgi:hypothetical protein